MNISDKIINYIQRTQGDFNERFSGVPSKKGASDLLSPEKPREQISLLRRYINSDLRGKRLLEIGSGLGVFNVMARTEYGIDAWGVEPSTEGFWGSFETSIELLKENGLSTEKIVNSIGEMLPFEKETFDIVFSTNVLEHVMSPEKVIREAIRVCKRGGVIQIVTHNYGSFYDGHYACFYFPYQPKWFWKIYIKYVLKKDTSFADTLRTEINYFTLKKWIAPFLANKEIEILSYGEEILRERMNELNFSSWASLGKVKRWAEFIKKLGLTKIAIKFLIFTRSLTPIILTIKKI